LQPELEVNLQYENPPANKIGAQAKESALPQVRREAE